MPFGPRKVKIQYDVARLTHYGGVYLLHKFFSRMGFKDAIAQHVRIDQRNTRYTTGEMILAILYPVILGLERLEVTHLLRQNGIFQYLSGLKRYPDATSLRRFLFRCSPDLLPKLTRLHDCYLKRMILRPKPLTRFILDLDSTVLTLYGKQENAKVGYNPKKPGRPSYHPLLCFEGQTKDFWHGLLRPGDTSSMTDAVAFVRACLEKLPKKHGRVFMRADKGFYAFSLVELLELSGIGFVIVARLTSPIQARLSGLRYTLHSGNVATAEFRYKPHGWKKVYRFVVIRRPQAEDSTEQLTLFRLGKYHYQVLVTNLDLLPLNLWRFYNDRAGMELLIKQLKADYTLGNIPTRHFQANEAYFLVLLVAYNLMNWFKRLCLPPQYQKATLQSLRHQVFLMPAELIRSKNKYYLALPPVFDSRREAWEFALKKIDRFKF